MLILQRNFSEPTSLKQGWNRLKRVANHTLGALELWDFAKTKDGTGIGARTISPNAIHTAATHQELKNRFGTGIVGKPADRLIKDKDREAWRAMDQRGNGAFWNPNNKTLTSIKNK